MGVVATARSWQDVDEKVEVGEKNLVSEERERLGCSFHFQSHVPTCPGKCPIR